MEFSRRKAGGRRNSLSYNSCPPQPPHHHRAQSSPVPIAEVCQGVRHRSRPRMLCLRPVRMPLEDRHHARSHPCNEPYEQNLSRSARLLTTEGHWDEPLPGLFHYLPTWSEV